MKSDKIFLVNMKRDSSESLNMAEDYPQIVDSLKKKYQLWIEEVFEQ